MEIQTLEGVVTEADMNWLLSRLVRPGSAVRQISVSLIPGKVLVSLDGDIPLIGSRTINAQLSPLLKDGRVYLTLEKLDVPLVPRSLVCAWVASQAKADYLSASGNELVVDVKTLLSKVRLKATISRLDVHQGFILLSANQEVLTNKQELIERQNSLDCEP